MTKIVIICGPSASGKNTIIDSLFKDPKYNFLPVITNTTRPKRSTDVDGQIYHFLTNDDFKEKTSSGYFLEYESTHGYFYGTAKNSFDRPANYLMQSDIRGASSIKKLFPDTLIIFINLPIPQIIKRLEARGSSREEIKRRLDTTRRELEMIKDADLIVENSDGIYDQAFNKIKMAIDKFLSIR